MDSLARESTLHKKKRLSSSSDESPPELLTVSADVHSSNASPTIVAAQTSQQQPQQSTNRTQTKTEHLLTTCDTLQEVSEASPDAERAFQPPDNDIPFIDDTGCAQQQSTEPSSALGSISSPDSTSQNYMDLKKTGPASSTDGMSDPLSRSGTLRDKKSNASTSPNEKRKHGEECIEMGVLKKFRGDEDITQKQSTVNQSITEQALQEDLHSSLQSLQQSATTSGSSRDDQTTLQINHSFNSPATEAGNNIGFVQGSSSAHHSEANSSLVSSNETGSFQEGIPLLQIPAETFEIRTELIPEVRTERISLPEHLKSKVEHACEELCKVCLRIIEQGPKLRRTFRTVSHIYPERTTEWYLVPATPNELITYAKEIEEDLAKIRTIAREAPFIPSAFKKIKKRVIRNSKKLLRVCKFLVRGFKGIRLRLYITSSRDERTDLINHLGEVCIFLRSVHKSFKVAMHLVAKLRCSEPEQADSSDEEDEPHPADEPFIRINRRDMCTRFVSWMSVVIISFFFAVATFLYITEYKIDKRIPVCRKPLRCNVD